MRAISRALAPPQPQEVGAPPAVPPWRVQVYEQARKLQPPWTVPGSTRHRGTHPGARCRARRRRHCEYQRSSGITSRCAPSWPRCSSGTVPSCRDGTSCLPSIFQSRLHPRCSVDSRRPGRASRLHRCRVVAEQDRAGARQVGCAADPSCSKVQDRSEVHQPPVLLAVIAIASRLPCSWLAARDLLRSGTPPRSIVAPHVRSAKLSSA